jgi:hypothetical protein
MATVHQVTSEAESTKFQGTWFLLDRVYIKLLNESQSMKHESNQPHLIKTATEWDDRIYTIAGL